MAGAAIVLIVAGGLLYVYIRWRRSPQAKRAMLVLASCYFVAGALVGICIVHVTACHNVLDDMALSPKASTNESPTRLAPLLNGKYTGPSFSIPPLYYDPAHAALPDPKLTPGEYTFRRNCG